MWEPWGSRRRALQFTFVENRAARGELVVCKHAAVDFVSCSFLPGDRAGSLFLPSCGNMSPDIPVPVHTFSTLDTTRCTQNWRNKLRTGDL